MTVQQILRHLFILPIIVRFGEVCHISKKGQWLNAFIILRKVLMVIIQQLNVKLDLLFAIFAKITTTMGTTRGFAPKLQQKTKSQVNSQQVSNMVATITSENRVIE